MEDITFIEPHIRFIIKKKKTKKQDNKEENTKKDKATVCLVIDNFHQLLDVETISSFHLFEMVRNPEKYQLSRPWLLERMMIVLDYLRIMDQLSDWLYRLFDSSACPCVEDDIGLNRRLSLLKKDDSYESPILKRYFECKNAGYLSFIYSFGSSFYEELEECVIKEYLKSNNPDSSDYNWDLSQSYDVFLQKVAIFFKTKFNTSKKYYAFLTRLKENENG